MNSPDNFKNIGIGKTPELNLRVSVATQVRVTFQHPDTGVPMLALEHRGTVIPGQGEPDVVVMVQPFGGAIQILNLNRLLALINNFHFDSDESWEEQDFRIYIRLHDWKAVLDFCLVNFKEGQDSDLETDPFRELVEEFEDALGLILKQEQCDIQPIGTIIEDEPAETENIHAAGARTVRIYRIFEAQIVDSELCRKMVSNSKEHTPQVMRSLAIDDYQKGNQGFSNAVFTTSMEDIHIVYQDIPFKNRRKRLLFSGVTLDGNVPAVLEGIEVPGYQFIGG